MSDLAGNFENNMTQAEFESIINFSSIEEFQKNLEDYAESLYSAGQDGSFFTANREIRVAADLAKALNDLIQYVQKAPEAVSLNNTRTALSTTKTLITYTLLIERVAASVGTNAFEGIESSIAGAMDIGSVVTMVGEIIATDKRNKVSVDFDNFVFKKLTDSNIANLLGTEKTEEFLANFRKESSFTEAIESFRSFVNDALADFDADAATSLTEIDNEIASLRNERDAKLADLDAGSAEYTRVQDNYDNRISEAEIYREVVDTEDQATRQRLSNTVDDLLNDPVLGQTSSSYQQYNTANTASNIGTNLFFLGSAVAWYLDAEQEAKATEAEVSDLVKAYLGAASSQFIIDNITQLLAHTGKSTTAISVTSAAGSAAAGAAASLQIAQLAASLKAEGLTDEQKAYIQGEIAVQSITLGLATFAGAMSVVATAAKAGSALANFATSAVPIIGGIISVLSVINPAQWSYFGDAHAYIDEVEGRDDYSAQYLADILGKSLTIQEGFYGASTGVSAATGVLAAGLALGGVTAPVAALVGLVGGIISGILQATQQIALEDAADEMRAELEEAFGSLEEFFSGSFKQQREKTLEKYAKRFDKILEATDAESVIALGSETLTASDLELAAIVKARTELGNTAEHFVNRYTGDDNWQAMALDQNAARIELNNADGTTHYLAFTTPLLAPGREVLSNKDAGKNQYHTALTIIGNDGWTIIDNGNANTTFNLQGGIVSYERAVGRTGYLRNVIDARSGNDVLIAGQAAVTFDGGDGVDTVSYRNFDASELSSTGLRVTSSGNSVTVEKRLDSGSKYLQETIEQNQKQNGKRTETLEYRAVRVGTRDEALSLTDILINIEVFQATSMADSLDFLDSTTIRQIFGFGGNDTIIAGRATQVISGGSGNDTIIIGDSIFDRLETYISNHSQNTDDSDYLIVWGDEGSDTVTLSDKWLSAALTNWQIHALLSSFVTDGLGAESEEAKEQMLSIVNGSIGNNLAKLFEVVIFKGIEEIHVNFNDQFLANSGKFGKDNLILLAELREALKLSFTNKNDNPDDFIVRSSFANVSQWLQLVGTEYSDYIIGTNFNDIIYGGAGNDRLTGGRGSDTLGGGAGHDIYYFEDTKDAYSGSGYSFGNDVIVDDSFDSDRISIKVTARHINIGTLFSKSGLDLLITISAQSTIRYLDYLSAEFFKNAASAPSIDLTTPSSSYSFSFKQVVKQIGLDHLFSIADQYDIIDQAQANLRTEMPSGYGNFTERQYASDGDDIIHGGHAYTPHDGKAGFDIINYENSFSAIKVDLNYSGTFNTQSVASQSYWNPGSWHSSGSFTGYEGVIGSFYDDILIGNGEDNFFFGGQGVDTIIGGGGNDLIRGGAGIDNLDGGSGSDIASYEGFSYAIKFDLNGSQSVKYYQNSAWHNADNVTNFEGVIGSAHDDTIIGNSDRNYFEGGSGDDTLTGGGGLDVFVFNAGDGHDTITDFDSDDILRLGSENTLKIEQDGDDIVLTIGEGETTEFTITLTDFEAAQLNMDNVFWA